MEVLRIKCFQETACYTKPFATKVTETYPLPPYSTVKGMIHSVLGANELVPFQLSVQGKYQSRMIDYRKTYMVKKKEFAMPIILDGLSSVLPSYDANIMTSMPLYTHMLYNVELVFHVKAEKEILKQIYKSFQYNEQHLSLGRFEDLVRIDDIDYVDIEEAEEVFLVNSIYIPRSYLEKNIGGIPYRLNWVYQIKNGIREWTKIPVIYVERNRSLIIDDFRLPLLVDTNGLPVVWNEN